MKMTKRWVAGLTIAVLVAAGCKKKHEEQGTGGAGSSAAASSSGSGGGTSEVAPSPAVSAASALATSTHQAFVDAASKLKTSPVADQVAKVDKLLDAAIALAQSEARDRPWDPASVIKSAGTDRAKLFAWVHDQTALVPYTGVLRGSVGVMMDRVGNSLDRSLLLANLLKQAGGEVRLAHATLDQANADKLAATWSKVPRPAIPTTAEDPAVTANLVAALTALGVDHTVFDKRSAAQAAIATQMRAQIDAQVGTLAKMVEATPAEVSNAAAVLADYWWVQVKDGEAWTDLDLGETAPGTSLVQATETMAPEEVPEAMRHTLAIRVIGEVWHDAVREETVLVDHAFTPAEFYGQRLMITATGVDMPEPEKFEPEKDRLAAIKNAIITEKEWAPMIVMGATPVVHFSVTDEGELYNLMDPNQETTRVAKAVQRATKRGVGGATETLEGMPDTIDGSSAPPKPPVAPHSGFTAEWVELEVRAPNQPPRIVRRPIFDAYPATADRSGLKPTLLTDAAKLDRGLALTGEVDVLAQFARVPREYFSDRLAKYLAIAKPAIVALVQNRGNAPPDAIKDAVSAALPPPDELDELGLLRFTVNPSDKTFIDRIDVLTARRRLGSVAGVLKKRQAFDIITNGVGSWGEPDDARKARLAQGIADTVAESVLLPCVGANDACIRGPNTSDAFVNARAWTQVSAASAPAIAALQTDARLLATSDLASGYTLVMAPDGKPATWWRVRADTGEVLGQVAVGGGVSAETVIMMLRGGSAGLTFGFCLVGTIGQGSAAARIFGCAVASALGSVATVTTNVLIAAANFASILIGGISTLPAAP